jgi:sterol 3beta-glucosyltransferase
MRITVLAVGSRGEVEPLVALAAGLQDAGHVVRLATHEEFAALTEGRHLEFARLWGSLDEALATPAGQRLIHSGRNFFRAMHSLFELIPSAARRLYEDCWSACQDAQAIVYGQITVAGPHIAQKLRVPAIAAFVNPVCPGRPTAAFPAPGMPGLPLGGWYNCLTHVAVASGMALVWQPTLNRWRRTRLGLRAVRHARVLPRPNVVLYGFSPTLVPPPREWDKDSLVSGYWFLEPSADWQPPRELVAFLNAGPAPVYVGFGTMKDADPSLTPTILEALKRTRQRGVLLMAASQTGPALLPDNVFAVDAVPFRWLFPRMSAVVHHGGLGTCHAALWAGVPQVVVPFMGDQPFWGARLARLGVSPAPIPRRRLCASRLATAIVTAVGNPRIRQSAVHVSLRLARETGVETAVRFIERRLSMV